MLSPGKVAMDLAGRTAKEHIKKATLYDEKSRQHWISAGLIIQREKDQLAYQHYWLRWLEEHDISRTTAYRAMQWVNDPETAQAAQEKNSKDTAARARAQRRSSGPGSAKQQSQTFETSGRPQKVSPLTADQSELIAFVKTADPDTVLALRRYVECLQRSDTGATIAKAA